MSKIALVVPSSTTHKALYKEYPLGVGYIGTVLKQKDHVVQIFDQATEEIENEDLIKRLEAYDPEIIGFSIVTATYSNTLELIKILRKSILKTCPIIGGGIHVTLFPIRSLIDGFDVIIKGAGEKKINEVVAWLADEEKLADVPGIVFRNKMGQVIDNEDKVSCANLDELPIVDRSLYNIDLYTHHSIAASRGCYYTCKFCCNYSGTLLNDGVSVRSVENVISEIEYLRTNFMAKDVFFVDDIFFLKKSEIIRFCKEIIKRKIILNWYVQLRIDYIDEEVANYLFKAHCKRVYLGVESGSDKILKDANKGITREMSLRAIKCLKEVGIRVKTGWIYGLPGTLEEQKESITLMIEAMPNDISIHKLIPFPGTEYYTDAEKYGIQLGESKDFSIFSFSGMNEKISFEYMSNEEYLELLKETEKELKVAGYVSSDEAKGEEAYIYTIPLNKKVINVIKNEKTMPLPLKKVIKDMNPYVIAIEGPNGVGKSTVCKALNETGIFEYRLGVPEAWMNYEMKKRMIFEASWMASAFYFLSGTMEVKREIQDFDEDTLIIMDRSIWSTLAVHWIADETHGRELINIMANSAEYLPIPDLVIVLKTDYKNCQKRINLKTDESKDFDKVSENEFMREMFYYEWLEKELDCVHVIDNTDYDACETFVTVKNLIMKEIEKSKLNENNNR